MEKRNYERAMRIHGEAIMRIRKQAHELHQQVNQTYGRMLPYGYHLDMVAGNVEEFGHEVLAEERDLVPLFFGAFYHDAIEDARQSYNDVRRTALRFMDDGQALMATEIVYALTNDKGRTRAERAGERYYAGIRQTPYAPFVKFCDRMANICYSCAGFDGSSQRMKEVYKQEMPHFVSAIDVRSGDCRLSIPDGAMIKLAECLIDDLEREENKWWLRDAKKPY